MKKKSNLVVIIITILMFISCFNNGGSSSLRNTTWEGNVNSNSVDLSVFGIGGVNYRQRQTIYTFGTNDVTKIILRGDNVMSGQISNRSVDVGTYTVSDNTITITFDSGVIEGKLIGSQVIQIDGDTFTKSK